MYYEIQGSGDPLVLIHGGFGSTAMFDAIVKPLTAERQVITLDLQGHGRTALTNRPMNFDLLANDVQGLVKSLGLARADLLGFSFGGMVALRTALTHPEVVRKLVVVSAPFKRKGLQEDTLQGFADEQAFNPEALQQAPIYPPYLAVAPQPQDWPRFVEKMGILLREDYDWSKEVAATNVPTMVTVGDTDIVKLDHAVEFFELLTSRKADEPGPSTHESSLCVLPHMSHFEMVSSPELATSAARFLNG